MYDVSVTVSFVGSLHRHQVYWDGDDAISTAATCSSVYWAAWLVYVGLFSTCVLFARFVAYYCTTNAVSRKTKSLSEMLCRSIRADHRFVNNWHMAAFPLAARAKITVHHTGNTVYVVIRKEVSLYFQALGMGLGLVDSRGSIGKCSSYTCELGDPKRCSIIEVRFAHLFCIIHARPQAFVFFL